MLRGDFSCAHRAFHKALPVSDVLAGKEHLAVGLFKQGTNAEALAGAIESIRAVYPWIILPGLIDGVDKCGCGVWRDGIEIVH